MEAIAPPPVGVTAVPPAPVEVGAIAGVAPVLEAPAPVIGEVGVEAVAPPPVAIEALPGEAAVTAPDVTAQAELLPPAPVTLEAPTSLLAAWETVLAAMAAGLERIANGAQRFAATAAQAATVVGPLTPAFAGGPALDFAASLPALTAAPILATPTPDALPAGAIAAMQEVRVIIDVLPSALFDVKQRRVTLEVLNEETTRRGMGAARLGQ